MPVSWRDLYFYGEFFLSSMTSCTRYPRNLYFFEGQYPSRASGSTRVDCPRRIPKCWGNTTPRGTLARLLTPAKNWSRYVARSRQRRAIPGEPQVFLERAQRRVARQLPARRDHCKEVGTLGFLEGLGNLGLRDKTAKLIQGHEVQAGQASLDVLWCRPPVPERGYDRNRKFLVRGVLEKNPCQLVVEWHFPVSFPQFANAVTGANPWSHLQDPQRRGP